MFSRTEAEQWVLEWSHQSNNIHIQPLARATNMNTCRFILDQAPPNDYVTLVIGSYDEVSLAADRIRQTLTERDQARETVYA